MAKYFVIPVSWLELCGSWSVKELYDLYRRIIAAKVEPTDLMAVQEYWAALQLRRQVNHIEEYRAQEKRWAAERELPGPGAPYEILFWGEGLVAGFPRYQRYHNDFPEAKAEALRVLDFLSSREDHPAMIHGPGCGRDGKRIV